MYKKWRFIKETSILKTKNMEIYGETLVLPVLKKLRVTGNFPLKRFKITILVFEYFEMLS